MLQPPHSARRHAAWCRTATPKLHESPPDDLTEAALDACLLAASDEARADLRDAGRLLPEPAASAAGPARWPPDLRACLARAFAIGRPETRAALWANHVVMAPRERLAVLASCDEPQRTLFHRPLDLARLPRLATGLRRLFALVIHAGVAPERVFGASSPEALVALRPTLAELFGGAYYGGHGAPLYASAVDLAACARELAAGASVDAVIDRRLAAPFIHELSHFQPGRQALFPPYLDECLSGWFGILALPALAFPAVAEAEADDGALCLAPAFGHVGEHLVRLFGRVPLLQAHANVRAWDEVLTAPLLEVWQRMAWEQWAEAEPVHFLGDPAAAAPWLKAAWLAAAGALPRDAGWGRLVAWPWSAVPTSPATAADEAMVRRAVLALSLTLRQTPEGAWRVVRAPTTARIVLDAAHCEARLVPDAASASDPPRALQAGLKIVLSPAWAAGRGGAPPEVRAADPWLAPFADDEGLS